jgi:hypothetical protein
LRAVLTKAHSPTGTFVLIIFLQQLAKLVCGQYETFVVGDSKYPKRRLGEPPFRCFMVIINTIASMLATFHIFLGSLP